MSCATKKLNRYFEDLFAECGAILNHYHEGLYTPTEAVGELLDKLSAAKEVCVKSDHLQTAKADVLLALEDGVKAVAQDIATPTRPPCYCSQLNDCWCRDAPEVG